MKPNEVEPKRTWLGVFVHSTFCLFALAAVALVYFKYPALNDFAHKYRILKVGWWGGLGGVLANYETIARTGDRWNRKVVPWLLVRPVTAGFFGGVGYVIYVSLVQASVTAPNSSISDLKENPTPLGYVIAFALGLREQTFRELLKRVVDLLATAGGADVEPPSAPANLRCSPYPVEGRDVYLRWGHATDNVRVTSYNIYRNYRFLASVRLPSEDRNQDRQELRQDTANDHSAPASSDAPWFVDRHAPPGLWFYAVTALDAAGNESDAAGPIKVFVPDPEPLDSEVGIRKRPEADSEADEN